MRVLDSLESLLPEVSLTLGVCVCVCVQVPSFFGKKPSGTSFDRSHRAHRCTYFVSHSWRDDGRRKVQMLREFLYLQGLVAKLVTPVAQLWCLCASAMLCGDRAVIRGLESRASWGLR